MFKPLQFIPVHNARECVEGMLNIAKVHGHKYWEHQVGFLAA